MPMSPRLFQRSMHKYLWTASIFSMGQARRLRGGGDKLSNRRLKGSAEVGGATASATMLGVTTLGGCCGALAIDVVAAGVGVEGRGGKTDSSAVDGTAAP